ncbi:MAG: hypothetical protein VX563_03340, partial [Planctomycetota bacterium]|nr:hypothetical protein [Planctomycetota bacterium]
AQHGGGLTVTSGLVLSRLPGADRDAAVSLFSWSWTHQGTFIDLDGSLVGDALCAQRGWCEPLTDTPNAGWAVLAHNSLSLPSECARSLDGLANHAGMACRAGLMYRRVMMKELLPDALGTSPLLVSRYHDDCPLNEYGFGECLAEVPFSPFNDAGYQLALPVGLGDDGEDSVREYELHSAHADGVEFEAFLLHSLDAFTADAALALRWTLLHEREVYVNGSARAVPAWALPFNLSAGHAHGASAYDASGSWVDRHLNVSATALTAFLAGELADPLPYASAACTLESCGGVVGGGDYAGRFAWSDPSFWAGCGRACFLPDTYARKAAAARRGGGGPGRWLPAPGDDVVVPASATVEVDTVTAAVGLL